MLDSERELVALDKKNMLNSIEQLPDHLVEGVRKGSRTGPTQFSPRNILVCGVGGSAIGGDLLQEWLASSSTVPFEVVRSYEVPGYVQKDTLAIVASYSGNTEETLSMCEDLLGRKARIVAISSGGRLEELCRRQAVPLVKLPEGFVPRATLGYVFGAMLGVLERCGIAEVGKQTEEAARVMAKVASVCGRKNETADNPAKKLAHQLFTCVPVVVGFGLSWPVARRWADQICENGKSLAFSSELPEMNHNEIVGWAKDSRARNFAPVFLDHGLADARMQARAAATKSMLGNSAQVFSVEALGRSPLAQMFSLIIMGDFVSAYIGFLHRQDPSDNEPIDRLKEVLSKSN